MKNEYVKKFAVITTLSMMGACLFTACGDKKKLTEEPTPIITSKLELEEQTGVETETGTANEGASDEMAVVLADSSLMAMDVETEADAQNIADAYGITLTSYEGGIATFSTEENPNDVIARGLEKGLHQLFVNTMKNAE